MEYKRFPNNQHDVVEEFFEKYDAFSSQPIVKAFFSDEENKQLLERALVEGTTESQKKLDDKFRDYYSRAKATKYFSNLIYFNSINFDKRIRKYHDKNLTILNQPLSDKESDSEDEWIDRLEGEDVEPLEQIVMESGKLEDHILNEELYGAIQQLSPQQKEVLELIYVRQLKMKEIADLKGTSAQNISKIHRQSIKKMKNYLEKG
ncbi:sigma-70 family RNA polymerase sigma factor [Virgibacillus senegalensis]|uniref:sigma-70 family RNA polymerase sigma factor n=1 Tax=Virgibacillus senegalensis TaxID=1499679 RepID=UPI00069D9C76|nr:sigma-70 family RNA polymerase sigma factor [Virgibacillus senegalensis]